jgi:hypothetical protein
LEKVKRGFLKNAQSSKPATMLLPPAIAKGCASMDCMSRPPVLHRMAVINKYRIEMLCVNYYAPLSGKDIDLLKLEWL